MGNLMDQQVAAIMRASADEARRFNHDMIEPDHLLLSIIRGPDTTARTILVSLGFDLKQAENELLDVMPAASKTISGKIPPSRHAKRVVEEAINESRRQNRFEDMRPEDILVGLYVSDKGFIHQMLHVRGITVERIRAAADAIRHATAR